MRNRPRFCWNAGLLLAFVLTLACGAARAAGDNGFRTDLFVPPDDDDCAGVSECARVSFPAVTVAARRRESTRASCPVDHPNLWSWDTGQHEHIRVELAAIDRQSASITGINQANVPGDFVVYLYCSTRPYTGTQLRKSRALAPTKSLPPRQEARVTGKRLSVDDSDPCTEYNVPFCQTQQQVGFFMHGSQTGERDFTCTGEYPYVWNYSYVNSGPHGLPTSIGTIYQEVPQTIDVLWTNWSWYETGTITVTLACSKTNSFGGGACGAPIQDPMCPVVNGTLRQYCSRTIVPVCIDFWQERCSPGNTLYNCTEIPLADFCQPCPG